MALFSIRAQEAQCGNNLEKIILFDLIIRSTLNKSFCTIHDMANDAFAKRLANVEKQETVHITPATELLVGEDKLTDVLKGDFQLQHIRKITPFFNGSVQLPDKMFDLIQTSKKEIVNFQVISFLSENEVYLLVILDLEFYSLKSEAHDPFREFEEFDTFANLLKPSLGLRHLESYDSHGGYYSLIEVNSKIHSAFLYKV